MERGRVIFIHCWSVGREYLDEGVSRMTEEGRSEREREEKKGS